MPATAHVEIPGAHHVVLGGSVVSRCDVDPESQTLHLYGEFDLADVDMLAQACSELIGVCVDAATPATVDADGLTFIDASGIGLLVSLHDTLAESGVGVRVAHPSVQLRKVFAICGLEKIFGLAPDRVQEITRCDGRPSGVRSC